MAAAAVYEEFVASFQESGKQGKTWVKGETVNAEKPGRFVSIAKKKTLLKVRLKFILQCSIVCKFLHIKMKKSICQERNNVVTDTGIGLFCLDLYEIITGYLNLRDAGSIPRLSSNFLVTIDLRRLVAICLSRLVRLVAEMTSKISKLPLKPIQFYLTVKEDSIHNVFFFFIFREVREGTSVQTYIKTCRTSINVSVSKIC